MSIEQMQRQLFDHLKEKHGKIVHGAISQGLIPSDRLAVTFRPGDYTDSFIGKRFRPLGVPLMITLTCEHQDHPRHTALPLRGYNRYATPTGWQDYGDRNNIFHYNGIYQPKMGAHGRRLDPAQNPSLVIALIRMFRLSVRSLRNANIANNLKLPVVTNGYSDGKRPEYIDTPHLRLLAAHYLQIPESKLGQHGESILQEFLRHLWAQQWISPDHPENGTGHWLVDERLCDPQHPPVARFEDFKSLLGVFCENHTRNIQFATVPNPALQVRAEFPKLEQLTQVQVLSSELTAAAVQSMGQLVNDNRARPMDLLYGLLFADQPLRLIEQQLPKLRQSLDSYWAECTTDRDLLQAAYFSDEPLWASGACQIQIVKIPQSSKSIATTSSKTTSLRQCA